MTFETEQLLVDEFIARLASCSSPWGEVQIGREFDYSRGRTDVIVLHESGEVMAFEAKLNNWRVALHQAYRNTCFANRSFVLLPKHAALTAANFCQEFGIRGVGLCYLDNDSVVVLHEALQSLPLEPWLAAAAAEHIQQHV